MKKSTEFLNLPVVSIIGGYDIGISKMLVIDAKNARIIAIAVEDEKWYRGAKFIPYEAIYAVGSDAITVENADAVLTMEEASHYTDLLDENIRIIGTRVITRSGTIVGVISEIYIDEQGHIEKCEVKSSSGAITELLTDNIFTFDKKVTIVDLPNEIINRKERTEKASAPLSKAQEEIVPIKEDATFASVPANKSNDSASAMDTHEADLSDVTNETNLQQESAMQNEENAISSFDSAQSDLASQAQDITPAAASVAPLDMDRDADDSVSTDDALRLIDEFKNEDIALPKGNTFVEKKELPTAPKATQADSLLTQRLESLKRFIIGQQSTSTIAMANGMTVVRAGEVITEEVWQKAKLAKKIPELARNIR